MKKILAFVLTLAMVLTLFSVGFVVSAAPEGTAITDVAGLKAMQANGKYYLANDIVLNAADLVASTTEAEGGILIPAGVTLDGNGKAIKVAIKAENPAEGATKSAPWAGPLFKLGAEAKITIKNISFGTAADPILLSSTADAKTTSLPALFANDTGATAAVDATDSTPAVPATLGTIVDWTDVEFFVEKDAVELKGGVIMLELYGTHTFTDCTVNADIDTTKNFGMWMYRANDGSKVEFVNCATNGSLTGNVSAGFVYQNKAAVTFTNCVNNADIAPASGSQQPAGFVKTATAPITFVNCVNNGDITGKHGSGFVYAVDAAGTLEAPSVEFINCVNNGKVATVNEGAGYIREMSSNKNNYAKFVNCVNNADIESGRAGGFICNFNTGASAYFEGCAQNGDCTSTDIRTAGYIAQASGAKDFTAINCVNNGKITSLKVYNGGRVGTGGFVGHNDVDNSFIMTNCANFGEITSPNTNGGLNGYTEGAAPTKLTNCVNYGYVHGGTCNGGITGQMKPGNLVNCANYGFVQSNQWSGGIIGKIEATASTLTNCVNYSDIEGSHGTGGIIGEVTVGTILTNCVNFGDIKPFVKVTVDPETNEEIKTVEAECLGGLVGRIGNCALNVQMHKCANFGTVTGSSKVQNNWGYYATTVGQFIGGYQGGVNFIPAGVSSAPNKQLMMQCFAYGEVVLAEGAIVRGTWNAETETVDYAAADLVDGQPKAATIANDGLVGGNLSGVEVVEGQEVPYTNYVANGTVTGTVDADKLNAANYMIDFVKDADNKVVVATPALRGYQTTEAAEGKMDVRLVATVNTMAFEGSLAFVVDGETKTTYTVYEELNNGEDTIEAADVYGAYMFTVVLEDVATTGTEEFVVKTVVTMGETTYEGATYKIVFEDGVCTFAYQVAAE